MEKAALLRPLSSPFTNFLRQFDILELQGIDYGFSAQIVGVRFQPFPRSTVRIDESNRGGPGRGIYHTFYGIGRELTVHTIEEETGQEEKIIVGHAELHGQGHRDFHAFVFESIGLFIAPEFLHAAH